MISGSAKWREGRVAESWSEGKINHNLGDGALALLQGYPFTGLARIVNGEFRVAPAHQRLIPDGINWRLFWDVRAFGPLGELHAWKLSQGNWQYRFAKARLTNDPEVIRRHFPIWGKPTRSCGSGGTKVPSRNLGTRLRGG